MAAQRITGRAEIRFGRRPIVALMALCLGIATVVVSTSPADARSECVADAENDLRDQVTGNPNAVNPRADITTLCVDHRPGQLLLSVRLGAPSDIATDPAWEPGRSALVFEIDVNPPGEDERTREYDVVIGRGQGAAAYSVVRVADGVITCSGLLQADQAPGEGRPLVSLTLPTAQCVPTADGNSPTALRAGAYVIFQEDQGNATFDELPDRAERFGTLLGTEVRPAVVAHERVIRLAGATRLETAIAASQQAFPTDGSAAAVVLATGAPPAGPSGPATSSPDALAAAPLATHVRGPVLLLGAPAASGQLPANVLSEIDRVLAPGATVYLVGGSAAIDPHVEQVLEDAGYAPLRLAGVSREGTSLAVALEISPEPTRIVLADGGRFEFALLGAAYAAQTNALPTQQPGNYGGRAVLLLTTRSGTDGRLDPVYEQYLTTDRPGRQIIAIGQAAAAAAAAGGLQVTPANQLIVEEDDVFATAVAVANRYTDGDLAPEPSSNDGYAPVPLPGIRGRGTPTAAVVTSGTTFADALGGAALAGRLGAPLLFSWPESLPQVVRAHLRSLPEPLNPSFILGGPAALDDAVASQMSVCAGVGAAPADCRR